MLRLLVDTTQGIGNTAAAMARTPTADRPLVAQWLIHARETQGWSATAFLAELQAATGAAPNYSTYALWESGSSTPRESSLAPVVRFWSDRGVDGPSATKEPGPSGDVTGLVIAMTAALLAQTQALTDLRADLAQVREDATSEREAMTRMLARLEARLSELVPLGDTGARAAGRGPAGH